MTLEGPASRGVFPFNLRQRDIQASAGDLAALDRTRATIEAGEPGDQARLALKLVEVVSKFAGGRYADAADTLKGVSPAQRIGVGGSRVERMLI